MNDKSGSAIDVIHILLEADKPMTVKEIQECMKHPMQRKQIYAVINKLEEYGFKTIITRRKCTGFPNEYEVRV